MDCLCCAIHHVSDGSSVATHFFIAHSFYKKVLLMWWCVSLVDITHEFMLNEVEFPHYIAVAINF